MLFEGNNGDWSYAPNTAKVRLTDRKPLSHLDCDKSVIAWGFCKSPEQSGEAVMLWLFHRSGEYLYCEARTCLENSGYELVVETDGRTQCEWFANETQLVRRWDRLNRELRSEGWANWDRDDR